MCIRDSPRFEKKVNIPIKLMAAVTAPYASIPISLVLTMIKLVIKPIKAPIIVP